MPFGSSKAAILGASGGSSFGYEYSGSKNEYTNWNSTGYTFVELTTSGNLEFTGDGTIDMVVVGGGGGYDVGSSTNNENGGGGGGGVVQVTGFEVVAETISVTIGAKGTWATSSGNSGTNGGQTELTMNGVNIAAGGGGRGGMGGWGYCSTGTAAPAITAPSGGWGSVYRASGGGGGGGGRWYTYCGGGGGSGRAGLYAGTPASGTWWPDANSSTGTGGAGGNGNTWASAGGAGGGAGGGYDTNASSFQYGAQRIGDVIDGGQGLRWQDYGYGKNGSVSTTTNAYYGSGDGPGQDMYPFDNPHTYSSWGKGAAWVDGASQGAGQDGVVILRFADI